MNRCQWLLKHKTCSTSCKYSGQCGGVTCKKIVFRKGNDLRSSPKMTHIIQNSNRKFQSLSWKSAFSLNLSNQFVYRAHSFKMSVKQFVAADIQSMYMQVIDNLLKMGKVLLQERRTLDSLYNEITKIKKDFTERWLDCALLRCIEFNNHWLSILPVTVCCCPGVGGYQTNLIRGGFGPRSDPLPFYLRNGQCLACIHPIRDARG